MASHALKILTIFTCVVAFMNFIYYGTCPVPLPTKRRLQSYSKPLYTEVAVNRQDEANKSVTIILTSDENTSTMRVKNIINWTPLFKGEDNSYHLPWSTIPLDKLGLRTNKTDKNIEHLICPSIHPYLGPTNWKDIAMPIVIDKVFSYLEIGGSFQPTDCVPIEAVAVLIPYRGPTGPRLLFLFSLHLFLLTQLVEYQIFVIKEVSDYETLPSNPGKLYNIGFIESQKLRKDINFTCIVFHDPFLAPTDSNNVYRCSEHPKQLVARVQKVSYEQELGGVVAIRPADFRAVNGFSNLYADSESAYLDLYDRLVAANYTIAKPSPTYAVYDKLIEPEKYLQASQPPIDPFSNAITATTDWDEEGLASLSYSIRIPPPELSYTIIEVDTASQVVLSVTRTSPEEEDLATATTITETMLLKKISQTIRF